MRIRTLTDEIESAVRERTTVWACRCDLTDGRLSVVTPRHGCLELMNGDPTDGKNLRRNTAYGINVCFRWGCVAYDFNTLRMFDDEDECCDEFLRMARECQTELRANVDAINMQMAQIYAACVDVREGRYDM